MACSPRRTRRPVRRTVRAVLEVVLSTALGMSVGYYIVAASLSALLIWQAMTIVYVTVELLAPMRCDDRSRVFGRGLRWAWVLPFVAALIGLDSAVAALDLGRRITEDLAAAVEAVLAAFSVILSCMLIHTGFSDIYEALDRDSGGTSLAFPGEPDDTSLKYLYFAVTIGTSFATSDVSVLSRRARQVTIVHSIISFSYNAFAVAVAFQVFHKVAGS
ncbi:DUF1345 domain-containing protein [Actinomyces howellii]|uniref:Predicted membrane protein n=1 Tax=Actinomyces howellii TaxID=52771 RepID=A0A448HHQ5_9ACTO|nr:DUF1345 domain-containing protein [Actinomyces howellii]VEG28749.1 Predicted membrane protein [Actinomyces howellii]